MTFKKNFLKRTSLFVFLFLFCFSLFSFTSSALASDVLGTDFVSDDVNLSDKDPRTMAAGIINIILSILGIVAVSIVIYGGFIWMNSEGNEERVQKAKDILKAGVIGLAIILSAWGISAFVLERLSDSTGIVNNVCEDGDTKPCGDGGVSTCVDGSWGPCIGSDVPEGEEGSWCSSALGTVCAPDDSLCNDGYVCNTSCVCVSENDPENISELGGICDSTDGDGVDGVCATTKICNPDHALTCEDCECVGSPVITGFSPVGGFCQENVNEVCEEDGNCTSGVCNKVDPNSSAGNFLTIFGYNFSDTYIEASSTVKFINANDEAIEFEGVPPSVVNSNCGDTWSNTQIIISFPEGFNISDEVFVEITTYEGKTDRSNDNIGPNLNNIIVNNIKRPGLCRINPIEARVNQDVLYYGVNLLENKAYFGNQTNSIAAFTPNLFEDNFEGTVIVPGLNDGDTSTFTKKESEGVSSNFLDFNKLPEPPKGPSISFFEPTIGRAGQYVTIYGSGFEDVQDVSEISFYNGTDDIAADFSFPMVCMHSVWKDDQVIVKVPEDINYDDPEYQIRVKIGTWDSVLSDDIFIASSTADLLPSLCKMSPTFGPAGVTNVSFWGEYFEEDGQSTRAVFNINKESSDLAVGDETGAQKVSTLVPEGSVTGPARISRGGLEGNGINFTVGVCSRDSDCPGSNICCGPNTNFPGSCEVNIADCFEDNKTSSVFEWDFISGFNSDVTDDDDDIYSCNLYNYCPDEYVCPNSPGFCSSYDGLKLEESGVCSSDCSSFDFCGENGDDCEYLPGRDRCVLEGSSCTEEFSYSFEVNEGLFEEYNKVATCKSYNIDGVGERSFYEISVNTNCPNIDGVQWTIIYPGKCVNVSSLEDASTCDPCPSGSTCSEGVCLSSRLCSEDYSCEGNVCVREGSPSCDCCCDINQNEGVGGPNPACCTPLTCSYTCGVSNNEGATDDDYGWCSGCNVGDDTAVNDAACNCFDTNGKYCEISSDYPDGICVDCTSLGEDACKEHSSTCCFDDVNDVCRAGAGDESVWGEPAEETTEESGTFTDGRDGEEYDWVKIGDQIWMSENLRYLPAIFPPGDGSESKARYYVHEHNEYSWNTVGTPGFSTGDIYEPSLHMHEDTPYVAYRDSANSNKITVMRYNGSSWETVGVPGFSEGEAYNISLYIYDGIPYVSYRDRANSYKATVMKYNGSSWEAVGTPGFSVGGVYYTSLYVYEGIPYVSYRDGASSNKATVMKYNGTSWETVGAAGFSNGSANGTSLYIYDGIPYVAYRDGINPARATVMKYNGSSWETVGTAGFSDGVVNGVSLYIYDGTPYVSYTDEASSDKATVMKYNGSSWETVGTAGFSVSEAYNISLYVYDGTPHVAYRDGINPARATVMKYNGSSWETVGTAGFSDGRISGTSLYVYNGVPYVFYRDGANSDKATVMKYDETIMSKDEVIANESYQTYGVLYNNPAALTACPSGWHLPTHEEFTDLERTVCTSASCETDFPYDETTTGHRGTNEGSKLAGGYALWNSGVLKSSPDFGSSSFNALPVGFRNTNNSIYGLGSFSRFWLDSENSSDLWSRYLINFNSGVNRGYNDSTANGFSVRCVKNDTNFSNKVENFGLCPYYNCDSEFSTVCDTANPQPDGLYKDIPTCDDKCAANCGQFTSFESCSSESNCCWDIGADGGPVCSAGDRFEEGGNAGYCMRYDCAAEGNVCDYQYPNLTGEYLNLNVCHEECAERESGFGESCTNEDGISCVDNCNPFTCLDESGVMGVSSNCGFCCCDPRLDASEDVCSSINEKLSCYKNIDSCSGDNRGLCCGCEEDLDCTKAGMVPSEVGCASDTCCKARPEVTGTNPENNQDDICHNASIEVDFSKRMNVTTFSGNVLLLEESDGPCSSGTYFISRNEDESFIDRVKNIFKRSISFVANKIYGREVLATASSDKTYCSVLGVTDFRNNPNDTTSLVFKPNTLLKPETKYFFVVKGDEDLDSNSGVLDKDNIGLNGEGYDDNGEPYEGSHSLMRFNNINFDNSHIISFETMEEPADQGGICEVEKVVISPSSYLFQRNDNDLQEIDNDSTHASFDSIGDSDKAFYAYAFSNDDQILRSVAGYSWTWDWSISRNDVLEFKDGVVNWDEDGGDKRLISVKEGVSDSHDFVEAEVVMDSGNVTTVGDGTLGRSDVYVFVCRNPWPAVDFEGNWYPWRDTPNYGNYNYEFYYCRDSGSDLTSDDLPAFLSSLAVTKGPSPIQICSNEPSKSCSSNSECSGTGVCISSFLKETYFFKEAMPRFIEDVVVSDLGTGGALEINWESEAALVENYKIYYRERGTDVFDERILVDTEHCTEVEGRNVCSYNLENLLNNVSYEVRITALSGNMAETELSSSYYGTPTDSSHASPPTNVSFEILSYENKIVRITWDAPADYEVDSYRVYRGVARGVYGDNFLTEDNSTEIDVSLEGTENNTFYFVVRSVNPVGIESNYSNEIKVIFDQFISESSGVFIDERDGENYNWVRIGDQIWMAENMSYDNGCSSNTWVSSSDENWCGYYDNDEATYSDYGMLYQWSAAMNGTTTEGAQGICPEGWHVPTKPEMESLISYSGGASVAGEKLKASSSDNPSWNGTNDYNFNLLPSGLRSYYKEQSSDFADITYLWSSTIFYDSSVWAYYFDTNDADVVEVHPSSNSAFSVRCIKD